MILATHNFDASTFWLEALGGTRPTCPLPTLSLRPCLFPFLDRLLICSSIWIVCCVDMSVWCRSRKPISFLDLPFSRWQHWAQPMVESCLVKRWLYNQVRIWSEFTPNGNQSASGKKMPDHTKKNRLLRAGWIPLALFLYSPCWISFWCEARFRET